MASQTHDLHSRISELRGAALDVLAELARADLGLTYAETGGLVQALQQVGNRLGYAAALLASRPAPVHEHALAA